jgi:hypothetical protein
VLHSCMYAKLMIRDKRAMHSYAITRKYIQHVSAVP